MMKQNKPLMLMMIGLLTILICAVMVPAYSEGERVKTQILSDFDIFDADIRDVFRSLAEIGDINVLLDPSVKGQATIKLKHGLTIKEAMELLAQTYGYAYRWVASNRTILIGNAKTFSEFETKETKVYQLNYAQTDQVVDALKVAVGKDQIGVDKRTNQLTIKASVLEQKNIEEIVKRLDREMPQINIEARIEELSKSASEDLGLQWSFGDVTGNIKNIEFNVTTTATISALEQNSKARLLARPNISTVDSQEGKIFIGERYPIVTKTSDDESTSYTVNYVEYGTSLKVVPRINENNVVTVQVNAYVSSKSKEVTLDDGNIIPVVSTREASSVVRLKDGETFVLSGLNMDKNTIANSRTPGLGRIPLLGKLFSKKNISDEDTELVIFLTPKIVTSQSKKEVQEEKVTTETGQQDNAATETKPETAQETAATSELTAPAPQSETQAVPDVSTTPEEKPQPEPPKEETPAPTVEWVKFKVKHPVKPGETVSSVAAKYGVASESICRENKIEASAKLTAGTEIAVPIPDDHLYALKPKETLWRLSKRYGTTVEILMELNNLTDNTTLGTGQTIVLPVAVDQAADSKF